MLIGEKVIIDECNPAIIKKPKVYTMAMAMVLVICCYYCNDNLHIRLL